MSRIKIGAALIFILMLVVLPLYELADYGEHWPHDGEYATMMLAVFFVIGLAWICQTLLALVSTATNDPSPLPLVRPEIEICSSRACIAKTSRFLTFCDLRV